MNKANKLNITFAPMNDQNGWTRPVSPDAVQSASLRGNSARFTVNLRVTPGVKTSRNSSRRTGADAALRIAPVRHHYVRRRLFAPIHRFEHRLP